MDMHDTAHTEDDHRGYRGRHRRAGLTASLASLLTVPLTFLGRRKTHLPTPA